METAKEREIRQAKRNLNPHSEAILAMNLWNEEYAFKQKGGVMDFWNSIGEARQRRCRELIDRLMQATRAPNPSRRVER